MFGALRRLLMSGDIAGVLQSSRRAFQDLVMGSPVPNEASRARALEGLNERGGFSDRPVFSRNPPRGVTMDQSTTPAYTMPWESPRYNYETARGYPGVYDTAGPVRRSYYAGPTSSEIVAPYEGFRVWPYGRRPAFSEPDWIGRNPYLSPEVDVRLYDDGLGGFGDYLDAFDFRPFSPMSPEQMRVPRAFGGESTFYQGDFAPNTPGRLIPFEEIMAARGSLFPPPFKPMRPEDVPF